MVLTSAGTLIVSLWYKCHQVLSDIFVDKDNQWQPLVDKKGKAIDGQATFRMRHFMGEAVFWLKPLYQLGFVRFFNFYFWIRDTVFYRLLILIS
jgi:hypothetical protein